MRIITAPVESVIYVVSGRARMKWGDRLEFTAEAGPGDFIYVPPFVPHQEINASDTEPLSCVLCRSGQEPVVVNLDLPNVEPNPEEVHWVDNIHPAPAGPGGPSRWIGPRAPSARPPAQRRDLRLQRRDPRLERGHPRRDVGGRDELRDVLRAVRIPRLDRRTRSPAPACAP